jgi:hypothetical protein
MTRILPFWMLRNKNKNACLQWDWNVYQIQIQVIKSHCFEALFTSWHYHVRSEKSAPQLKARNNQTKTGQLRTRYPEPHESTPRFPIKRHRSSFTLRNSNWSLFITFPHRNPVFISLVHLIMLDFTIRFVYKCCFYYWFGHKIWSEVHCLP